MYSLTEIQLMEVVTAYNNILAVFIALHYTQSRAILLCLINQNHIFIIQRNSRFQEIYRILPVKSSTHKYNIKE